MFILKKNIRIQKDTKDISDFGTARISGLRDLKFNK